MDSVKLVECPRDAWQGLSGHIPAEVKAQYLRALIGAVEARDAYTHGHSARVADLSVRIGLRLGLRPAALRTLAIKGVLLFLMAYVGSAVAGRGIGMYAASRTPDAV